MNSMLWRVRGETVDRCVGHSHQRRNKEGNFFFLRQVNDLAQCSFFHCLTNYFNLCSSLCLVMDECFTSMHLQHEQKQRISSSSFGTLLGWLKLEVRTLWSRKTVLGPSKRMLVLIQQSVFLFYSKPGVRFRTFAHHLTTGTTAVSGCSKESPSPCTQSGFTKHAKSRLRALRPSPHI